MKKAHKYLLLLVLSILFAAALVACGKVKDPEKKPEADTEGPVITFEEHDNLTVKAGESLRLPAAHASDNVDGDLTDELFVLAADMGPVLTKDEETEEGAVYIFVCYAKGEYRVAYKVTDSSDNNGIGVLTVTVTADRDDETAVSETENQIANIAQDGGVYKENFAKGWKCPLAENGLPNGIYLSTTADAIAGTSMIISEFSEIIKFGAISVYTHGEAYYDVSFDVKLVSGTGASAFYVSFADLASDQGISDQRFPLNELSAGETIHFDSRFRVFGVEDCYFRFFVYNESTDMVLALDNLEIKYSQPVETYVPTAEEIAAGYTWNWSDKTMDVECGEIVEKPAEIVSDTFGEKVLKVNVPVGRGIVFFGTMNTFIAGERYEVKFDYFVAAESDQFSMYYHVPDTTGTNIGSFSGKAGDCGSGRVKFVAQDGDKTFALYLAGTTNGGNAVLYIGNFTLKKIAPAVDTDKPTAEEIQDGYTWDWSENTMDMENNQGEIVAAPEELDTIEGFGENVLKIMMSSAGTGFKFTGTDGIFETGKTYKITAKIYASETSGGFNVHWNLESTTMTGLGNFADSTIGGFGKAYTLEVTFTAQEGDTVMGWYPANLNGTAIIYVGDFSIIETALPIQTDKPTAEEIQDGYTWDWSENTMDMENNQGEIVAAPEELDTIEGFGENVLKITMSSAGTGFKFTGTDGIFETGKTYKITAKIYAPETSGGFNVYWNLESATGTTLGRFDDSSIGGKGKSYTLEVMFTAQEGDTVIGWYPAGLAGTAIIYVGNFTLTEVVT